jgi:hypothetical protein
MFLERIRRKMTTSIAGYRGRNWTDRCPHLPLCSVATYGRPPVDLWETQSKFAIYVRRK